MAEFKGCAVFSALAGQFARGLYTPRDYLEQVIERFDAAEPMIKSFVSVSIQRARIAADASAARWKSGCPLSPIDGMPIGVKDIIDTDDMPTELGTPLFKGWRPRCDAAAVYALRQAGVIVFGKTETTELASTYPSRTRNPHDGERTPGGSSSGSASAVGAGIVPCALGTQVIGSTIRPASFCGAFGFKPTVGALNRGGCHDHQSHSCLGVIGSSLGDMWSVAQAIVHRVGGDPGALGLIGAEKIPPASRPSRLAIVETPGWAGASPGAKDQFARFCGVLRRAGVDIVVAGSDEVLAGFERKLAGVLDMASGICDFESRWPTEPLILKDRSGVSQAAQARMSQAGATSLPEYRRLLQRREALCRYFRDIAPSFDGFLTLSASGAAPKGLGWTGDPTFAVCASVLGAPAISLPVLEDDGMPLGVQLVGALHADEKLFAYGTWMLERFAGSCS